MGNCLRFLGRDSLTRTDRSGRFSPDLPLGLEEESGEEKPKLGPALPWWWWKVKELERLSYSEAYADAVKRERILLDFGKVRNRELEEGASEEARRSTHRHFQIVLAEHEQALRLRKGRERPEIPDCDLQALEDLDEPGPSGLHLEEVD